MRPAPQPDVARVTPKTVSTSRPKRVAEEVGELAEEELVEEEGEVAARLKPGVNGRADLWCAGRPALLELAVQGDQVGADCWARKVLGQKVSGVGGPTNLEEREMTSTQPLLDPQLSHR